MRNSNLVKIRPLQWLARAGLTSMILAFVVPAAGAQDAQNVREIERDAISLRDRIQLPTPPDVSTADTAIVFTNVGNRGAAARCVAFDYEGQRIGQTRVRVPARGMRWLLASDLSDGERFIGNAQCFVNGQMLASAIFLGPAITDLPVKQASAAGQFRVAIPVLAHY